MFDLSSKNLDLIINSMNHPLSKQKAVFEFLGINSNDYCPKEKEIIDARCAIARDTFDTESVLAAPLEYLSDLTEERATELSLGASLTPAELEKYFQDEAEKEAEGSADTFAVIFIFSDGSREVYGLCIDLMMGQGGNAIIDFYGFFKTITDADSARDRIAEYIIV